jgi:hypothetical protein
VAEAIGQLAAWVGMSAVGFTHRPVAALAGDTRMHRIPKPGETLELIVDIESCDAESIQYKGRALVGGQLVLELQDTLGSMLDIHEFDAPEALSADFEVLKNAGRAPGAFGGVPQPVLTDIPSDRLDRLEATLAVPEHVSRDLIALCATTISAATRADAGWLPGARLSDYEREGARFYSARCFACVVCRNSNAGRGRFRTYFD